QKINTKAATREDVGVIFGKALDTISGYDTKSNASLSYKDKAQVSAAAVPYLELLYRANLMVGDTDNNFSPKANISRAEMAVLSVKTYNKLTETAPPATQGSIAVGTVSSRQIMANGDLFLSLTINTGNGLSLFAAEDKVVPRYNGDKITFEDIGSGDTVKVTYAGTDITALEVIYSKNGIRQTTEETYELVDITSSKVTVLDEDEDELEYRLMSSVDVTLAGKDSTIKKLQNAMVDAKYDVTLTLNEDERVTKIKAVMNDKNPLEGTLIDMDDDAVTIQAGSKEYTYPLDEGDISIKQDGKTMTFSKLKKDYDDYNYVVTLKLNSSYEVTGITITDYEDETKGMLTFLNSRRITITAAGEEYTYNIDTNELETVKIDGKRASLEELRTAFDDDKKAFTIELDVDRDDYVTEILAETKYAEGSVGELERITSSEITIDVDGTDLTYRLSGDVEIEINGKNRTIADLQNNFELYAFDIKLNFNSLERVSKVEATMENPEEGFLKDIVEDRGTITVTAGSIDVTLELTSSADITLDGDDVSLTKLNNELDYADSKNKIFVELTYNKSGKVTEVEASWEEEKPASGDLYRVYPDDNEIVIEDNDGNRYTYEVKKDADISVSFSANANEHWYEKPEYYNGYLEGLREFMYDCRDNKDDCYVSLTLNASGDVTKIRARAE
ncbi:MAG: S-layer homology domain-containing protein, partial [Lachnospiraceae bacterium]|nr:S-layer homology domain-containing protein [Lachnospiraceae bacterium]